MGEMECPVCGALNEIPAGIIEYELIECYACDEGLEYSEDGLRTVDSDS